MIAQAARNRNGELVKLLTELDEYVYEASRLGAPIHEVEMGIWQRLLAMGHDALAGFIASQGDGDLGKMFTMPDGRTLNRLESTHRRSYQSIFGEYAMDRVVYGSREGQKIEFVPLDQRLQLPESEFSYLSLRMNGTEIHAQPLIAGNPWRWISWSVGSWL